MDLRCPHCGEALELGVRAWVCPRGHSFDRARQGYVNLLRAGVRARGDSAAMLRARRRFLDAGYYAPLADAIAEEMGAWLAGAGGAIPLEARALVDCGCGEGYYLDTLAGACADDLRTGGWRPYGFDVARDAVHMAAGRGYGGVGAALFVANVWERLPFKAGGVGVALVVFAPRNTAEFARVIAPGGLLLIVTPAPAHLTEARAALPALLAPQAEKSARLRAALAPAFTLTTERAISFPLALDGGALADLAEMTPHRAGVDEVALRAAARAMTASAPGGRLAITAAFVLSGFIRATL
jgi:23S rRNA (guanine745-N1)-methyltransferase